MIRIRDDVLEESGHSFPEFGSREEDKSIENAWDQAEEES